MSTVDVTSPAAPPAAGDLAGDLAARAGASADITITSGTAALLRFARPARGRFALAAALAALSGLLGLVPYWAIYRTLDELVTGAPSRADLWRLASIALVAIVARFAIWGVSIAISHMAAYEVLYGIRLGIAEHLAVVPLGQVTRRRAGEMKKVMGDDVERLELFLAHGIADITAAVVTLIAVPVWLFVIDWRMAIATIVVVFPAVTAMGIAIRRSMPFMAEYHRTLAEMNASVVELVRGMPVVKVFNRGTDRVRDAERAVDEYVVSVRKYSADFLPLGTAFFVLLAANVVLIVPLGIWLHDRSSLSTTDLLFFLVVGLGALAPVLSLLHLFGNLSHVTTGGNLVAEVFAIPPLVGEGEPAHPVDSSVELDGVVFSYDDPAGGAERRRALDGVTLRAAPGTLTALVGPSGGGKTTIAALIARFYDVDAGAVRVGGADVRHVDPDELSRHVAVVLQDTFLFDDTVAANLRIAKPDATVAELEAAARAARAHEFVTRLPLGYETVVGERGASLSGGERQRLTLARAILADAPVIVLDEATAFADPENEALIQEAIEQLVAGKTVITIAHRLSTISGADQILVVDEGRITERGTHEELLDRGGTYARLWEDFTATGTMGLGDAVRRDAATASALGEVAP